MTTRRIAKPLMSQHEMVFGAAAEQRMAEIKLPDLGARPGCCGQAKRVNGSYYATHTMCPVHGERASGTAD